METLYPFSLAAVINRGLRDIMNLNPIVIESNHLRTSYALRVITLHERSDAQRMRVVYCKPRHLRRAASTSRPSGSWGELQQAACDPTNALPRVARVRLLFVVSKLMTTYLLYMHKIKLAYVPIRSCARQAFMNPRLRVPALKLTRFGKMVNKSGSLTPNQEPKVAPN